MSVIETATHYLVLDRNDGEVLAWFPIDDDKGAEATAKAQAERLARDTGNRVVTGRWGPSIRGDQSRSKFIYTKERK